MDRADKLSFEFVQGFLERSLEMDPRKDQLLRIPEMNLMKYRLKFEGMGKYVYEPIRSVIRMQRF